MFKGNLKKYFAIVLVLVVIGSILAGCSSKQETQVETTSKKLTIAFLPAVYDRADFFGQFGAGIWAGLDEAGIEYDVFQRSPATVTDHSSMLNITNDAIGLEPDYIVFGPTSYEANRPCYEAINAAGIPLVIGNYSEPFPEDWGTTAISYIGYSHADGGKVVAEYIAKNYPKGTKIAVIHGIPGYITEERAAVEIHKANGMEIVTEQNANWERQAAFDTATRILTAHPDVEIIIACNSFMALGSSEAVIAAGMLEQVDVFGAGGILEELEAIQEGRMKFTWFRDPGLMGREAANAIIKHLQGKESEIVISNNVSIQGIASVDDIIKYVNPVVYTSQGKDFPTK